MKLYTFSFQFLIKQSKKWPSLWNTCNCKCARPECGRLWVWYPSFDQTHDFGVCVSSYHFGVGINTVWLGQDNESNRKEMSTRGLQFRKLTLWIFSSMFLVWSVLLTFFSFLCCPIMCLYVLSFVLWCQLRFPHQNDVRFVFTSSCL